MKLLAKKVTYEYTPEDIAILIAHEHGVDPNDIEVNYVIEEINGDPMDRFPGTDTVTKIRVTVDDVANLARKE